jgi:hypothetical protein
MQPPRRPPPNPSPSPACCRFVNTSKDQRILKGRRHALILKPSAAKVDDSELHLDELRELRAQLAGNAALTAEDRARIKERLGRLQQLLEAAGVPVPEKQAELLELEQQEAAVLAAAQQGAAAQRGQQQAGRRSGTPSREASSARLA